MTNTSLLKVALRYKAIYLPVERKNISKQAELTEPIIAFCSELNKVGYAVSEELLHALGLISLEDLKEITGVINEVYGVELNWTPLVKHWDIPTGESRMDHILTFFANVIGLNETHYPGVTLPCGHFIPEGTFPIERYNGCPFCGTPFETNNFVYTGQGSTLRDLHLFTDEDMKETLIALLESPVPLDATQMENLNILVNNYTLPDDIDIPMKENLVAVVKMFVGENKAEMAASLFKSPVDIMRYLWFCKTGLYQIVEPKILIRNAYNANAHMWGLASNSRNAAEEKKNELKLKYTRAECHMVAVWMNSLRLDPEECCELMNSKREMWVRFIRALRLGEYSRKKGFEYLKNVLNIFYNKEYYTWAGAVNSAKKEGNIDLMYSTLKRRPGSFARQLFSIMLNFDSWRAVSEFSEVAHLVAPRLLVSLINNADVYFSKENMHRIVRPITGCSKVIDKNPLIAQKTYEELKSMIIDVNQIFELMARRKFEKQKVDPTKNKIYIDDALMNIPLAVGDRSATVQDASCAPMGMRFKVEGDAVRLFMQWGKGLSARHLDMDLSCKVYFDDKNTAAETCAYFNLTCTGCKHSGDIQYIPEKVGTAEYIEIDLKELQERNAKYVMFTCNAYSCGTISPNLVVGWMNSANPMKVSEKTGVAYDPSCVQHMVRISENNLSKGIVFGLLDVAAREIIWLEMPFMGQTIDSSSIDSVKMLLDRLSAKTTIGKMLKIKAEAQSLIIVDDPELADEKYTYEWALQPELVNKLLLS